MKKLRIGINGFGRIGRAITRLNTLHQLYELIAVNEIDPDIDNMAYLLKYDSTYGKLAEVKVSAEEGELAIGGKKIATFCESNIEDVPWQNLDIDAVVDSSGILSNVLSAKEIINRGIRKVVITHSPKMGTDFTYIYGVNDHLYEENNHHVVSSSICDANAMAPFYRCINEAFGVEVGEITTLHPWLTYQNLLDGNLKSVSNPGHFWNDYALGRSSLNSLIPKETSLVPALESVLPDVSEVLHASSFRTPISIVSAADGSFLLKSKATDKDVIAALTEYSGKYPNVLELNGRSLVSIDYLANENAAVVDTRRINVNKGKMLKFVLWYDNEWGYSSRVYSYIKRLISD